MVTMICLEGEPWINAHETEKFCFCSFAFVLLFFDNGAYHFDTASMSVNYSILLTHSPINREMWTPLFSFFVICFAFENFLIF